MKESVNRSERQQMLTDRQTITHECILLLVSTCGRWKLFDFHVCSDFCIQVLAFFHSSFFRCYLEIANHFGYCDFSAIKDVVTKFLWSRRALSGCVIPPVALKELSLSCLRLSELLPWTRNTRSLLCLLKLWWPSSLVVGKSDFACCCQTDLKPIRNSSWEGAEIRGAL